VTYSVSIVLSATEACFQLILEIVIDSKLKKHPRIALASTKYWLRVLTAKKIYGLALTKYIKDPINYLYIVGFTKSESEVESLSFFIFVNIGVVMDLQSIISKLISIP
jgi:hypothetical protein